MDTPVPLLRGALPEIPGLLDMPGVRLPPMLCRPPRRAVELCCVRAICSDENDSFTCP